MPDSPRRGFGTTIVQLLCQQLRAELTVEDAQPGVRATVKLPVNTAPEAA
jgi:two-component sensor histidine kinase